MTRLLVAVYLIETGLLLMVSPWTEWWRTNYFADLSFNILLAKFVGEVGMVSGGDIPTYNQFEGKKADDSRLYGSLGLRIGF